MLKEQKDLCFCFGVARLGARFRKGAAGEDSRGIFGPMQPERTASLALTTLLSPVGDLTLIRSERGLLGLGVGALGRAWVLRRAQATFPGCALIQQPGAFASEQSALRDLLAGELEEIAVPLDWSLIGEEGFARRVLEQVCQIPRGLTVGCGEMAAAVGAPGAARAVERIVAGCPLAIAVPTHRVVGLERPDAALSEQARGFLLRLEQRIAAVPAPVAP